MAEQQPPSPRFYPPILLLFSIILMVGLHYAVPVARWLSWPWRASGAVPVAAGLLLGLAASRHFTRHDTTIVPFEQSSELITEGPYRYTRNPLYLSMTLMLIGLWVFLGSLSPAVVVPLFVWWIATRFVAKEERHLEAQFGPAYRAYRAKVRRWF